MTTRNKFSPEVRERAVRMVGEHRADYGSEWAAMTSIAAKLGCTAETLRRWCREEASPRGSWLTGPAAQVGNDRDRLTPNTVAELRRRGIGIFCSGGASQNPWRQGKW